MTQEISESGMLKNALGLLSDRLPEGWGLSYTDFPAIGGPDKGPDGVVSIVAPDGSVAEFAMEAKIQFRPKMGQDLLLRHAWPNQNGQPNIMVSSRYLTPQAREVLRKTGSSYIDLTGNMLVQSSSPGLFILTQGASKDPWRGPGRPTQTLGGAPAAQIVRALIDFDCTWTARELVNAAEASTGSVYRVLELLESEGAVKKNGAKVSVPDWEALLRRWAIDYQLFNDNTSSRWIAPRGLDYLQEKAAAANNLNYAYTGTIAAMEWAQYAPVRAAMIYVKDLAIAAQELELKPADAGANVILFESKSKTPFQRVVMGKSRNRLVAPAQVAVDLLNGPGRSAAEAEELITWMKGNENVWRR